MLKSYVNDFIAVMPLQMPSLMDKNRLSEPLIYKDYALLEFSTATPLSLEDVTNLLEDEVDLVLLYVHTPSLATDFGRCCCAYSNPAFGHMYKVNAVTNSDGMVDQIRVTIYDDLELMSGDVINDLKLHGRTGHFKYAITKEDVLLNFIG